MIMCLLLGMFCVWVTVGQFSVFFHDVLMKKGLIIRQNPFNIKKNNFETMI